MANPLSSSDRSVGDDGRNPGRVKARTRGKVAGLFFLGGLLLLGAATWGWLTRPKPPADWLRVEAPAQVAPAGTVTLRITPLGLDGGLLLNADLHGTAHNHRPLRVVGHGRPQRVGPPGSVLEFNLTLHARTDLASVHAIIYVSPSGGWSDRLRVAQSEPIPVKTAAAADRGLRPLRTHEHTPDPKILRAELSGLRWLITLLWLVVAGGLASRLNKSPEGERRTRPFMLITACLAIALTEILQLEPALANAARQLALSYGLYDGRLLPQQLAIIVTVVAVTALAGTILFRARHRRLVLGLLGHAAIATAAILSLHEVDVLLNATIGGAPVEQLVKLTAVSLSLWGLAPRPAAP